MSVTAHGTTFTLRTPEHINSCHVTGSWDKYRKRYSMKQERPGKWTLTVNFGTTIPPARYWYYFILDGYFESHDPNRASCYEPNRKITLNILDYSVGARDSYSPVSDYSSVSSPSSSRFGSPTSTTRTSPISATSKRSGRFFDDDTCDRYSPASSRSSHSRSSSNSSIDPYRPSSAHRESLRNRTPSPRRRHAELTHIVHPKPRNPLAAHKLTLDTSSAYRQSVITSAATTASRSPVSASSSRSNSSLGSCCSSCSGDYSPTTPMCTCDHFAGHQCGYASGEDFSDGCYTDEEDAEVEAYRRAKAERRKSYYASPAAQEDLAYRLERGLRM